jgi:DNA-directed RNA polymerase specialized sigma24 family protein
MNNFQSFEPRSLEDDFANAFLLCYDSYIRSLVRKKFPSHLVHPDVLDLEIDDLVQKARVKLWFVLEKQPIINPNALITLVVRHVIIDMVRRHRPDLPLYLDAEDEPFPGHLLMSAGEWTQEDPASMFEQEEIDDTMVALIIQAIQSLPFHQRFSVLCTLHEHLDVISQFVPIFKASGIDIEAASWPDDKAALRSLKVSLSVSRKKLHLLLDQQKGL